MIVGDQPVRSAGANRNAGMGRRADWVGVAIAGDHYWLTQVCQSAKQFAGLSTGQLGALRFQMGCNEPDASRSDCDVSPGISAHEPECCAREVDIEVLAVIAAAAALDPDFGLTSDQDH